MWLQNWANIFNLCRQDKFVYLSHGDVWILSKWKMICFLFIIIKHKIKDKCKIYV